MTLVPAASSRGMPLGLAGATAATRFVGGTASGAPASGAFVVGDFAIDESGALFVCTVAGSPGTWVNAGAAGNLVTSVFGRTGAVVAVSGDYTAALVTNAADKSSGSTQTFTAAVSALDLIVQGLTGATQASRLVGATASGAPASGTFSVGDVIVDRTGFLWVCTAAGTPGTWAQVGAAGAGRVLAVTVLTAGTTWTTGGSTTAAIVLMVGGGGGGGGSATAGGARAAGGGAAAFLLKYLTGLTSSHAYTIAIGGGGAGGANTGATGTNGTDTTLVVGATTYTAGKGFGGVGSTTNTTSVAGGAGGTSTNGDVNGAGAPGDVGPAAVAGGSPGKGGDSIFGGGGLPPVAAGAGVNATGFGAGGSGAGGAGNTGGNGAGGLFVAIELS